MINKEHPCNICDKYKTDGCIGCIWDSRQRNCCSKLECVFYRDFCTLGFADECKLSDEFEGEEE